jgi:hypothetical protein
MFVCYVSHSAWSKHGDALPPLLFTLVSEHAIRKVQENQAGLKLKGTYQLLLYANNVNVLGENINTVKKPALNRF